MPSPFRLTALTGEFSDPVTEDSFLATHCSQMRTQLRTALLFCSCFYLAFALTDVATLGYTRTALLLLCARMAVALVAGAAILLCARRPDSTGAMQLAACVTEVAGVAGFMVIIMHRPNELIWHGMSMVTMLIVIYIFIPNRIVYAAAIALCATAAFIAEAMRSAALGPADLLTMAMLLVLANLFGAVAARRTQRLWREQFCAQLRLRELSVRDHLTGCLNRRHLHEHLYAPETGQLQRAQHRCLTVVMCDLDHFKRVNDRFGHLGGDAVLRVFSGLLKACTREQVDQVVRYGGEEFLLILPGTDLEGGSALAERLRAQLAAMAIASASGEPIRTTASFGVVTIDYNRETAQTPLEYLIASADAQLYAAKSAGRNRVKSLQLEHD